MQQAIAASTPLQGPLRLFLLTEQAQQEVRERGEEDEHLLCVHQDPAQILVLRRREAPEPRRVLVERVERAAREDQRQRQEGGADVRGAEVREAHRGRDPLRLEREDGPPEDEPREDQEAVLDVERPLVPEGPVVERRQVDAVPDEEPERQREDGSRQERERTAPPRGDRLAHRRREAKHEQRRRPVRDHHVLEQVDHQQVVDRDRLERRVEGKGDQDEAEREDRRARPGRPLDRPAEVDVDVTSRNRQDEEERLEAERVRGRRIHLGESAGTRARRSRRYGRSRMATQIPSVSSCSTIITAPARRWSVSGESPKSRSGWSAYLP